MSVSDLPPLGRHLLDRRGFLAHMGSGLGGIALGALLGEQGLLAAEKTNIASAPAEKPLAPRPVSYTHLTLPTNA